MFVEDYMTPDPVCVREDRPVAEAAGLMKKSNFRQLPVLDENQRLVGIITDRDIRLTVGLGESLNQNFTVSDVMTPEPITIPVSARLDEAVHMLAKHRFGALPVLRFNDVVGIITYIDVLRALSEILGLDQSGQGIEVALPEGFADLARAFTALKECGGTVISAVVSRTRRDGGEPALYLRVAQGRLREIEDRLRAATLILLAPET